MRELGEADLTGRASKRLVEVRILGFPIPLYRRATEYYRGLLRELELIRGRNESAGAVPDRLAELAGKLSGQYAQVSAPAEALLRAAIDSRSDTVDLSYEVPPEAAEAAADLLQALEDLDGYCRSGRELLTLVAPDDVVALRRWFLGQFRAQIGGAAPAPWRK